MINRRLLIFILFSVVLNACGQQGPLFMPIEDNTVEDETLKAQPIEDNRPVTEVN